MTREDTIEIFEQKGWWIAQKETLTSKQAEEIIKLNDAVNFALSALRPVSREKVERIRGEWTFKPFYKGTSRGAIECQKCKGAFEGSVKFNFCPNCGAPMTDEAVQMVIERLEALYGKAD